MLTQTTELAIKALIVLTHKGDGNPIPPRQLAGWIGCSATYLSKIMGQLGKGGVLRSVRGAHGGVVLARPPGDITLLEIVEACQGLVIGSYCRVIGEADGPVCAFHQAMLEIHRCMKRILSKYTLADLAKRPVPTGELAGNEQCRMRVEGLDLESLAGMEVESEKP
jgi:Rrf2 family protein